MNYCPHCSNKLKEECKSCKEETISDSRFCMKCGIDKDSHKEEI